MMNYAETIDYLFSRLPMFQRIGAAAYKANLDNTYAIDKILNHPHQKFKTIHIAGTNGKGSTSHYLASIFQEAGYKTGLYTSPHLIDFRERIKINGEMITENYIIDFVQKYKVEFEGIEPSFFEWTVGLAFKYFADAHVDVAIIETGLGGRLDSTNIISPKLSIITNISFDHKQFLGNTLELIAIEKAGIVKHNIPVVIGEYISETREVFLKKTKDSNSSIYFTEEDIVVKKVNSNNDELIVNIYDSNNLVIENLKSELIGEYQLKNIATVYKSFILLNQEFIQLNKDSFIKGIESVISNTKLLGRWQVISRNPLTICDTGHNKAGIKMVLKQLEKIGFEKVHFVLGFVNDKEVEEILDMLPISSAYYFCQPTIPRAFKIDDLKPIAMKYFSRANYFSDVKTALYKAQQNCIGDQFVFVGGSTFVVADALS